MITPGQLMVHRYYSGTKLAITLGKKREYYECYNDETQKHFEVWLIFVTTDSEHYVTEASLDSTRSESVWIDVVTHEQIDVA